jgi:hypothetical protein
MEPEAMEPEAMEPEAEEELGSGKKQETAMDWESPVMEESQGLG